MGCRSVSCIDGFSTSFHVIKAIRAVLCGLVSRFVSPSGRSAPRHQRRPPPRWPKTASRQGAPVDGYLLHDRLSKKNMHLLYANHVRRVACTARVDYAAKHPKKMRAAGGRARRVAGARSARNSRRTATNNISL